MMTVSINRGTTPSDPAGIADGSRGSEALRRPPEAVHTTDPHPGGVPELSADRCDPSGVDAYPPQRSGGLRCAATTGYALRSLRDQNRGLLFIAGCLLLLASETHAALPQVEPQSVGLDPQKLAAMDAVVAEGLAEKKMPGCVVCIGRQGKIAFLKAYGNRQVEPTTVPMTTDTVFDMASITKPVATATSILLLIERGQLSLSDKVSTLIPEFGVNDKQDITIRDLLIHQSGLIADNALADYQNGPAEALQKIYALKLQQPVGTRFIYSDVNFILLADIVQRVSGLSVHEFSQREIYAPLGMQDTGYLPREELRARAAPTEQREGRWMQGEVHDPRAYKLDGVAGHAGLFSTANDLAIYASMMLGGGKFGDVQIFTPQTVALMTRPNRVSSGLRGLGWDKKSGYSINKGDLLTEAAFGHGGFTGTVLWIDPQLDLFFIFLSNRVHPNGKGLVNPLAGKLATIAASAVVNAQPASGKAGNVLMGVDVLRRDGFRQLNGRKIGLITNHTGRDREGQSTVELLHKAENVQLAALYSPEHGFLGQLDVSKIGDTTDPKTGLPVFSLYGETRRPTAKMLQEIDTIVYDIQDIGCRFYTYPSTMGEAMRAAAEHKKKFVVLDRPNPIGGVHIAGPMLDKGKESFVGYHTLPVRHGLTVGELAKMFNEEFQLGLELEVIPCEGWSRRDAWDATGLTWVNPSPNMRSLTQAFLYPGIGLLETTNVSVGRGTDTPFEVVGAPWIDGRRLAAALNARGLPGVSFVPIEFTPSSSKFEKQPCGGINIIITQRDTFEPLLVGFEIAAQLRTLFPDKWETKGYLRLLGNDRTHQALVDGKSGDEIAATAEQGVRDYVRRRARFLIYEE
jgi:uncharacterized protein YbbC (DUF1343 family)